MQGVQSMPCTCGKQIFDPSQRCSSCAQDRQKRMSQHKYVLPERPARQLTPPPSQPTTPRRSMESSVTVAASPTPRLSYANEALTSAFNSEGGIATTLLPQSIYRYPTDRSTSRSSSIPSSRSSSETPSYSTTPAVMSPTNEQPGRKPSRSATPDPLMVGAYAPMAAGFARLSKRDVAAEQARRGRAGPARPSLELEARMFSGPA